MPIGKTTMLEPFRLMQLGSARAVAQHRVYGGGMRKSEPREAEKILVPDPRLLSEAELEALAALLDELDEAEREGRGERVRKALDEGVRKLLKRPTR